MNTTTITPPECVGTTGGDCITPPAPVCEGTTGCPPQSECGTVCDTPPTITCTDPYRGGTVVDCATMQPDPCVDGKTTLYHLMPCTASTPSLYEFCTVDPSHPVCANVVAPTSVPVGTVELPVTGGSGVLLVFAAVLTLAGCIASHFGRPRA
jgi:hypothetical protein